MKRNYNYPTISLSEIVVEQGIAASDLQSVGIEDWDTTHGTTVDF